MRGFLVIAFSGLAIAGIAGGIVIGQGHFRGKNGDNAPTAHDPILDRTKEEKSQNKRNQARAHELRMKKLDAETAFIKVGMSLEEASAAANRDAWTDGEKAEYDELMRRIAAYQIDHPEASR